ncbi:hypothetical protein [Burkholderia pyrrocinia]|uniref:hypothetical protein n=1 Tax=Burkholderia pyrrocinia TaxID=60550 RepID=UPI001BCCA362|nr:hypothetical protein [Burkholderia pyrrocinia]QVN20136.1 hypothetical protein JYG32_26415 [Burkholderia pyrrocinia]
MIEDVVTPQPGLKVYPSDADVFAEPAAALARHLHPLVSIDLSAVDPSWQDWIHLLVASVTGREYRAMDADWILLFDEPVSRVAVLTFDWT